jgi:hypothetical protein
LNLWTDAARGFQFGGKLDVSKGPFSSSIRKVLQVTCKAAVAGDGSSNATARGPEWVYTPPATPALEAGAANRQEATLSESQDDALAATDGAVVYSSSAADEAPAAEPPADGAGGRRGASLNAATETQGGNVQGSNQTAPGAAGDGAGVAAADAAGQPGAYIGCFDGVALNLDLPNALVLTPSTAARCPEHCASLERPLYALTRAFQCVCSSVAPHPSLALPAEFCEALGSQAVAGDNPAALTAVAMFYLHSVKGQGCGPTVTKLSWGTFGAAAAGDKHNVQFGDNGRSLTLRMRGAKGARVASRGNQMYGMLSFKAYVSPMPGVITSVQVSALWARLPRLVRRAGCVSDVSSSGGREAVYTLQQRMQRLWPELARWAHGEMMLPSKLAHPFNPRCGPAKRRASPATLKG